LGGRDRERHPDGGTREGDREAGRHREVGARCQARRSVSRQSNTVARRIIRSLKFDIAVYDTLFIELAARQGISLATFDEKVLKAFPAIAKRPRDLQ
jgi:predicted nucleic acid-binding protein